MHFCVQNIKIKVHYYLSKLLLNPKLCRTFANGMVCEKLWVLNYERRVYSP